MARKIEAAFAAFQQTEVIGVDQTKISDMIGTITHRAGQVWQDQNGV